MADNFCGVDFDSVKSGPEMGGVFEIRNQLLFDFDLFVVLEFEDFDIVVVEISFVFLDSEEFPFVEILISVEIPTDFF